MTDIRILLADNDHDYLATCSEFLESAGYYVLKAASPKEAGQILETTRVHLAVLDLRLAEDDDQKDRSGLQLAKETARSVPKLILTRFPTHQDVRDALVVDDEALQPAVDFVDKRRDLNVLLASIKQAVAKHVRISWELEIQWDQREHLSFVYLVSLLQHNLPNDILVQRADELEDLIRKLFYDYQQVRIGWLLWDADGRFCLPVLASSSEGTTDSRVLVCGERRHVEEERRRMEKLAPEAFPGTEIVGTAETTRFGASAYVLPGASVETVQMLRELFHGGGARPIKAAFNHLLSDVLPAWHQHGRTVEGTHDLMSLYRQWVGLEENGLSQMEVEQRMEALVQAVRPFISPVDIERGDGLVTFRFPNQSPIACPDPVATVYAPLPDYEAAVVCRISPGRLTAENVLVDAEQRAWLTDFARAGQAPQWWDYVCLEAIVRFDLSQAPDLLAWQEFEECLVAPGSLHKRLKSQGVIADLKTNIELIEQIRRQAGSEAGLDARPYYAGLLVWAVGALARYEPGVLYTQVDRVRSVHLLLAAAMIARRVGKSMGNLLPEGELRLDDDGSVWVGDDCIAMLMGQELDLLHCLLEHALEDRFVSRQTIAESVLGEKEYKATGELNSRINSLVSRLRDKIELDPENPRLQTIKGKGYRLKMS